MTEAPLVIGAVTYAPKVITIWEGFAEHLRGRGLPFDFVLYSNYESQVEAQLAGHIHVAWNSPLAWIETVRVAKTRGRRARPIAMRDADQDLTSAVLVRSDSNIRTLSDLRGKRVGVGATDSPQATLLPLLHLAEHRLDPGRDFEVVYHDRLLGKHGDHIGGERDAAKALLAGAVDAACVLDSNLLTFAKEGTWPGGSVRVLEKTASYDHCNFTVLDDAPRQAVERFTKMLLDMSYDDPSVRALLDLEGLKAWKPGRESGYAALDRAVSRLGTIDEWLAKMGATRAARGRTG
jgi:ABC-type phosphate/phosphonate transport system substrate-binding protein